MTDEGDVSTWRPLVVRAEGTESQYDALIEGVPPWLEGSLRRWALHQGGTDLTLVHAAERRLRISVPVDGHPTPAFKTYWVGASDEDKLNLVDFFLVTLGKRFEVDYATAAVHKDEDSPAARAQGVVDDASARAQKIAAEATSRSRILADESANRDARELGSILDEAGSAWRLSLSPRWGLERRVEAAMQALVETVSEPRTDAARRIASAWRACYGREPDYDRAYRDAVLAVEAAALPGTLPTNGAATLGMALAHIRDTVGRWSVGGLDDTKQPSGATLLAMLKTLWHNQERHASNTGVVKNVSRNEAEVAVSLAVTLVHWFSAGLVTKSS